MQRERTLYGNELDESVRGVIASLDLSAFSKASVLQSLRGLLHHASRMVAGLTPPLCFFSSGYTVISNELL
jgi:hypothetical protein